MLLPAVSTTLAFSASSYLHLLYLAEVNARPGGTSRSGPADFFEPGSPAGPDSPGGPGAPDWPHNPTGHVDLDLVALCSTRPSTPRGPVLPWTLHRRRLAWLAAFASLATFAAWALLWHCLCLVGEPFQGRCLFGQPLQLRAPTSLFAERTLHVQLCRLQIGTHLVDVLVRSAHLRAARGVMRPRCVAHRIHAAAAELPFRCLHHWPRNSTRRGTTLAVAQKDPDTLARAPCSPAGPDGPRSPRSGCDSDASTARVASPQSQPETSPAVVAAPAAAPRCAWHTSAVLVVHVVSGDHGQEPSGAEHASRTGHNYCARRRRHDGHRRWPLSVRSLRYRTYMHDARCVRAY